MVGLVRTNAMRETYRTLLTVLVLFYGENDVRLYHEEETEGSNNGLSSFGVVAGLQADLLDSDQYTPVVEQVGQPDKVFVHAGTLSRALGCTVQTARNRLEELERHGLVQEHGDIGTEVGNVRLFRPTLDNLSEYFEEIEKLAGNTERSEPSDLTPVTPSEFNHLGDGKWEYARDTTVVIDVTNPPGKSIRQNIEEQLRGHGLKATSMKNFQFQLRSKAGLT